MAKFNFIPNGLQIPVPHCKYRRFFSLLCSTLMCTIVFPEMSESKVQKIPRSCIPVGDASKSTQSKYSFLPKDTLSKILFLQKKIPPRLCLYGNEGWIKRNQVLNPQVKNWNSIATGTVITLEHPEELSDTHITTPLVENGIEAHLPNQESQGETEPQYVTNRENPKINNPLAWVGVRYGHSISKDILIEELSFVGLHGLIRRGKLTGLSLSFDFIPQESAFTEGGALLELGWNRTLVGWTFTIPESSSVPSLMVIPKLGRYSVSGTLPFLNDEEEFVSEDIHLVAMSVGGEVATEIKWLKAGIRPWIGLDISGRSLGLDLPNTVTSMRGGLDLTYDGAKWKAGQLSYLLFGIFEQISIESQTRSVTNPDEETSIQFTLPSLGIGVGTSL